jgi:hypothetical protein
LGLSGPPRGGLRLGGGEAAAFEDVEELSFSLDPVFHVFPGVAVCGGDDFDFRGEAAEGSAALLEGLSDVGEGLG